MVTKLNDCLSFFRKMLEQLFRSDKKTIDLTFKSEQKIIQPSIACRDFLNLILPSQNSENDTLDINIKSLDFDIYCSHCSDVIKYIFDTSDGIKIPLAKSTYDYFPNLSVREIKKIKNNMELETMLIRSNPTTYVLNVHYDWDGYFKKLIKNN